MPRREIILLLSMFIINTLFLTMDVLFRQLRGELSISIEDIQQQNFSLFFIKQDSYKSLSSNRVEKHGCVHFYCVAKI